MHALQPYSPLNTDHAQQSRTTTKALREQTSNNVCVLESAMMSGER